MLKRRKSGALAALLMLLLACPPEAFAQMGGGPPPGGGKGGMRPPGGGKGGPPGGRKSAGDEFNPATFSCLEYSSGLGENSTNRLRTVIARVWMQGNLTGLHRANGDLTLSAEAADRAAFTDQFDGACRISPAASILAVGVAGLAKLPLKMPEEIFGGIKISDYTCEAHLAAKSGGGGDAIKSDIAEIWAFAFIQGYKLAKTPDVVVPMEAKPQLIGAIVRACTANKKSSFLDLTAQVAEKVKLQ